MYNEFDPKHYKGKWSCTIKTLYNEKTLIGRLHQYFLIYFETFSVPTADTLFLLILSILTLESAHSIRFLYQHFLSGITEKSLNVFYYVCSYAKVDYSRFMNTTVRITLKLIPDSLQTQPVFLCVDDTMVSKFGTKFENVSKLFDHAAHNGSNYLNGHCFVSVMLCVPVWNRDKVSYLSVPLGYRMWHKKNNEDLILSGWAVFRIPYKKCTGVSNSFKPKYNRGVHYTCTPLLYFSQPLENKFLKKYRIKKKHPKRCSRYFRCYLRFNSSKRIAIQISFHQ